MTAEADPAVTSVGYGGLPDSNGEVTLDACIMDQYGNAGSVAFLKHIMHPVAVARLVMEKTPHVMLAGDGALRFALEQGFRKTDLLSPSAREKWEEQKALQSPELHSKRIADSHDTIGLIARDGRGNLSGACTTSGLAFKMPGRVGDSPIIGAGLYVDNEAGAATATGNGELVMKTLGSFLIVELMRNGMLPDEACREAIYRIRDRTRPDPSQQVGYIAMAKNGQTGAFSLRPGFSYALMMNGENKIQTSECLS
jgi:isoaspartyl peptidase/L-asparaginase-like protein (Ntn-hydrolase superfamily)